MENFIICAVPPRALDTLHMAQGHGSLLQSYGFLILIKNCFMDGQARALLEL